MADIRDYKNYFSGSYLEALTNFFQATRDAVMISKTVFSDKEAGDLTTDVAVYSSKKRKIYLQ